MCTLIISKNSNKHWPIMIASTRDEEISRSFLAPARHWKDYPQIFAGYDKKKRGSWLGINDKGLLVAILNRTNNKEKIIKTSRGQIVIEALKQKNSIEALKIIENIDAYKWKPFNAIVADYNNAYWIKNGSKNRLQISIIPDGVSMIDSNNLNDEKSKRYVQYYEYFCNSIPKGPNKNYWKKWVKIMSMKSKNRKNPLLGITIDPSNNNFGTVCSSLIAIPNPKITKEKPHWYYCDGAPKFEKFKNILI